MSLLFGGYYNFLEGIAWVPWIFWAAHKACRENSPFAWGLCGLGFSLQILAGAAQLFTYTLPAAACFALSTAWNAGAGRGGGGGTAKGRLLPVAKGLSLALGMAFLLAAPQLWPTLQYIPLSARQGFTHAQFDAGSMSLSDALAWMVPGRSGWLQPTSEYCGLLPWALACVALVSCWRKDARVRWMAFMALAALFFAQNCWTPFYSVFHHLPFLSGIRLWVRILFLVTFAVCVLAAFGWDALRLQAKSLRGAWVFLGCASAACSLAWTMDPSHAMAHIPALSGPNVPTDSLQLAALLRASTRQSVRTTLELCAALSVLFILWSRRMHAGTALLLALAFHAFDQKQIYSRSIVFMAPSAAVGYPRFGQAPPVIGLEPWRIRDDDNCYPNNEILLGYENVAGQESVPLQSYQRIKDTLRARPKEWSNLMNVGYLFQHSKSGAAEPGDTVTIYRMPGAFPRAWLVGRVRAVAGDQDAYRLLADPRFDPRSEAALESDPGLDGTPPKGAVTWLARGPEDFSLGVSTEKTAVLMLSNFWYPSWKAEVDGTETPILKADGGLQALLLAPGSHRVDIRFDPSLFYDALAACLAGLVALAGLAWL